MEKLFGNDLAVVATKARLLAVEADAPQPASPTPTARAAASIHTL